MSEAIERTWEHELVTRGEVMTRQEDLRLLLEERFGPPLAMLTAQIEAIQDPERLRAARRAMHLTGLSEFEP